MKIGSMTRAHPPHPADVAQGRRFVDVLRVEQADVEAQLAAIEARAPHECSPESAVLWAQLAEVRDLLDALEARFFPGSPAARGAA